MNLKVELANVDNRRTAMLKQKNEKPEKVIPQICLESCFTEFFTEIFEP